MMKRILKIGGLALASLLIMTAGHVLAANTKINSKNLDYTKQFKPSNIKPSLSIPSATAVKEVGGIQYGRHVGGPREDG